MSSAIKSSNVAPRTDLTSLFVCYSEEDESYAQKLTRAIADLGFVVHDIGLTYFEAYRAKIEQAIANSDYYIIVFSAAFFSERFANEQLNALFDSYVFKTGRGKKVLPIVREMSWSQLREMSPLFGTMRPMDAGKTDDDVRKLAKLFYGVVKKDCRSLPSSSKIWEWEDDEVEELNSDCPLAVRQVQLVDSMGNFSMVLVTDHQPNSNNEPGDLIVEVNDELLSELSSDALESIAKRLQTDSSLYYTIRRRKSPLPLWFYFDSIRKRDRALPTAETVDYYWSRRRVTLDVTTPVTNLDLTTWTTPNGLEYVLVTNPPMGCPLSYGDRVISIDNNFIDLTQIDFDTIKRKLLKEQQQVKLTVWQRQLRSIKTASTSDRKLWPHQLEWCPVCKMGGAFGLKLMKIKDPSTKQYLPVIMASTASGLFHGDLIVRLDDKEITDYKEALEILQQTSDKQEVLFAVRRPNKEMLGDYIQTFYTEDPNAPLESDDSDYDSNDEAEDTVVAHKSSYDDTTAIVGEYSRNLGMQSVAQVIEEPQTTCLPCQVTELEGNSDDAIRSDYFSVDTECRPSTEWSTYNNDSDVAAGKVMESFGKLMVEGELTHKDEQMYKQLISLCGETYTGCGRQKVAIELFRSQWSQLIQELDADDAADYLYENKVITSNDMEKINGIEDLRTKRRTLLNLIGKHSWMDGVQFAKILKQSAVNRELGLVLLHSAGSEMVGENPKFSDHSSLSSSLYSMVQSAINCHLGQGFKLMLDMMTEIADSLKDNK